jgi:adenosylcobinamide-GDP ribazoletransferase
MNQAPETAPDTASRSPAGGLAQTLADAAGVTRFFSRIPVPAANALDDPAALPDFRRAGAVAPLAGFFIALPGALALALLAQTSLPALAVALTALGLTMALTGALHEDGLADVVDGFFGGASAERRLEIMKDSRIGAFGALALAVTVLARASLLAALLDRHGGPAAAAAFLAIEAGSRSALVVLWSRLPPARPGGLAAACGMPSAKAASVAALIGLAAMLTLAPLFSLTATATAMGAAIVTGLGVARLATSRIGGQTGDVLGATQQLCGLAALFALAAFG